MEKYERSLILRVEQHECLYNKNSADYTNRIKRTQIWNKISKAVGKPPKECKDKWRNLRDTFFRLNKLENSMLKGSSKIKWKHFRSMRYLREFMNIRRIATKNYKNVPEEDESVIIEEQNEAVKKTEIEIISYQDLKPTLIYENRKDNAIHPINNLNARSPLQQFFYSIANQGEHLSRRKQLKLQMKCLKSLEEVELEDSD